MNPLNKQLYDALVAKYRHVEIVGPGQQASVSYRSTWINGKPRLQAVVTGGEYYKVSCRICNDTKMRLQFNHRWGTEDERTGQRLLHLVHCFNDDCIDCRDTQTQLFNNLFPVCIRRKKSFKAPVITTPVKTPPRKKIRLPKDSVPINSLPADHRGRFYLESRGFDVDELWERWGLQYCRVDQTSAPRIYDRIVIPIQKRKLVRIEPGKRTYKWFLAGWQARTVSTAMGKTPKYLSATGMRKSELLYGIRHVRKDKSPVVLVEGPTDVWRLGGNAVATLGKSVSYHQLCELITNFNKRVIVIAYDPDAHQEASCIRSRLQQERANRGDRTPVVVAKVPAGIEDIGECPREVAWKVINRAVRKAGKITP